MPSFTCFALGVAKVKFKILQAGYAVEHGGGVSEVDPLRQQVAAIGKVEKTLPILTPEVLAAEVRHVPPDACTGLGSVVQA